MTNCLLLGNTSTCFGHLQEAVGCKGIHFGINVVRDVR